MPGRRTGACPTARLPAVLTLRKAADRGRTRTDWLDSAHAFSFGAYRDPAWMGFGALRVLNEDRVAPGGGFRAHSHADMEILTFVVSGALAHRDDTGWTELLQAGEAQVMSAGTGITHSERNASAEEPLHFLQVWIEPEGPGLAPSYAQQPQRSGGHLGLAAAPPGEANALPLHADARVFWGSLPAGERFQHPLVGSRAWVQLVNGALAVSGARLAPGDGAGLRDIEALEIEALQPSLLLVIDLA